MTHIIFLDWINLRDKDLEPQELLKEFNKHYDQLSLVEVEIIKIQ